MSNGVFTRTNHRLANMAVILLWKVCGGISAGVRAPVDPCDTLCSLYNVGNCSHVMNIDGICNRLFWDENKSLRVTDNVSERWTRVTTQEALNLVSTKGQSCQSICDITPGCHDTFCKDNTHCQALFWESTDPQGFCYHTRSTPCNQDKPVLCAGNEVVDASIPAVGTMQIPDVTSTGEESGVGSDFGVLDEVTSSDGTAQPTQSYKSMSNATASPNTKVTSQSSKSMEEIDGNKSARDQILASNSTSKSFKIHAWTAAVAVLAISTL